MAYTGKYIRECFGLFIFYFIRFLLQQMIILAEIKNQFFYEPNFPSLLVSYTVKNDYFYSGHTGFTLYMFLIFKKNGRVWEKVVMAIVFCCTVVFLWVWGVHYLIDIMAGGMISYLLFRFMENRGWGLMLAVLRGYCKLLGLVN